MKKNNNYYWYILIIRGGKEKKIQNEISINSLKNQIKEIKIPLNPVTKKNILKGYLLLNCYLNTELVNFFYSLPDRMVIGFLGHDRKNNQLPEPVSEKVIENFLNQMKKVELVDKNKIEKKNKNMEINKELSEGDLVKINKGEFEGYEGKVVYLNKDKKRAKIILTELGWEIDNIPFENCQII